MRVLVLGGAGAVCSETTRDLAQYSDFDEIIVADYNLEAATALVEEIGDSRRRELRDLETSPIDLDVREYR